MLKIKMGLVTIALFFAGCKSAENTNQQTEGKPMGDRNVAQAVQSPRGDAASYDPGAARDSEWAKLFAMTPNYRAIGQYVLGAGKEKFRWIFGPMWYRGRLENNSVKVFVVGQEGAQDENISNRTFTGSTGTKTQNFLNYLGINDSYLFMNTFVYTINGQLDTNPGFEWLEQDLRSPIVVYRHALFNHMAKNNSEQLGLMMGIGAGGQKSLRTWVKSFLENTPRTRGKNICSRYPCTIEPGTYNFVDGSQVTFAQTLVVIGVPHPGGASPNNGGEEALQNIIRGFTTAARFVADFKRKNPNWLPKDNGATEAYLNSEFRYRNAQVPLKDFAFGTNWRMGWQGTSSNRKGSDAIQVFSDDGEYSGSAPYGADPSDIASKPSRLGPQFDRNLDYAWEPPKLVNTDLDLLMNPGRISEGHARRVFAFDPGPCGQSNQTRCETSAILASFPLQFTGAVPKSHPSFGNMQGSYRGRFDQAKIVIYADQESHDDLFSTRALTGTLGQQLQTWIESQAGVNENYLIIRSLPYDTLSDDANMDIQRARGLINNTGIQNSHRRLMEAFQRRSPNAKVYAFGSVAQELTLKLGLKADAININSVKAMPLTDIPRFDLPMHTRWWMGTRGSRAVRETGCLGQNQYCNYYRVHAPQEVANAALPALADSTRMYIQQNRD
ncbi:MAG: hypothetical protein ACK5P5_02145 [Pseudobdellovibrionaceae bacterium]